MRRCIALFGLATLLAVQGAQAGDADTASERRGAPVFGTYCVACHGSYGDGKGKAIRNLGVSPGNLRTTNSPDATIERIVRKGGAGVGRSAFMPPWEEELTEQQIKDVLAYLRTINMNKRASGLGVPAR